MLKWFKPRFSLVFLVFVAGVMMFSASHANAQGSEWSLVSEIGPSARYNHAMSYDSARGITTLFGGWNGSSYIGDTWEWDGAEWVQVAMTGPSPRVDLDMAYDSARNVTVLFGGWWGSNFGDTWEYHFIFPSKPGDPNSESTPKFYRYTHGGFAGPYLFDQLRLIDWTVPTVVAIHGWNSDYDTPWIGTFQQALFHQTNGAFKNVPDGQLVVVGWPTRAGDIVLPPGQRENRLIIWRGARNGFADGQLIGRALSKLPTDPNQIHLVAHSNGSAMAAGIAMSYRDITGSPIAQMTILDAPSEKIFVSSAPPTGFLAQGVIFNPDVVNFESWTSRQNVSDEFGGEYRTHMGQRTRNLFVDYLLTLERTPGGPLWWHQRLPFRYAQSAYLNLPYDEPGAFTKTSVTVPDSERLLPGTYGENSIGQWLGPVVPREFPNYRLEATLNYQSDPSTWFGLNSEHIGEPGQLAFRCEGVGDLYIEFAVSTPQESYYSDILLANFFVTTPFDGQIHVFCGNENDVLEYSGSIEVVNDQGWIGQQRKLLNAMQAGNTFRIAFWVPNDGNNETRGFEFRDVLIGDAFFFLDSR